MKFLQNTFKIIPVLKDKLWLKLFSKNPISASNNVYVHFVYQIYEFLCNLLVAIRKNVSIIYAVVS